MQPVTRARIAGGLCGAVGVGLMAVGEYGPGLAALASGATALAIVTERAIPERVPDAGAAGLLATTGALTRGLKLQGRGIVFPGGEAPSRLYIPARDAKVDEVDAHDPALVVQREGVAAPGVVLAPPGAGFEAAWREMRGLPTGAGAEEAALHLREALPALALGSEVSVARSAQTLRVSYVPLAFAAACRASREDHAPWHLQGACPACSFAAILVARALGGPVKLLDAGTDGHRVHLELEVRPPRSPA